MADDKRQTPPGAQQTASEKEELPSWELPSWDADEVETVPDAPPTALSAMPEAKTPAGPEPSTEGEDPGPVIGWLLVAALLTALAVVGVVAVTRVWDPYVCGRDEDCRGLKQCYGLEDGGEGYCVSPEIYQHTHQTNGS